MWKLPSTLARGVEAVTTVSDVLQTGMRTAAELCIGASRLGGRAGPGGARTGHRKRHPAPAEEVSFAEGHLDGLGAITLAYRRQGTGEPVVLLHGIGQDLHAWDQVVPLIAAEREAIALDLPGFGRSPDLPDGLPRDLPTMVAGLDAVFTTLGVHRPHLIGHSLGGLIALRLAQAGLARSVTALAPAGFWNEVERRYAYAVLTTARQLARLPDPVVERMAGSVVGRAALTGVLYGHADSCPPDTLVTCLHALRQAVAFEATLRAGRAPDLFTGTISDIPVTIAWGTCDRILPGRQAARVTAMIPQARLVQLPGCGHVPMNDAPDQVAGLILQTTAAGPAARAKQPRGRRCVSAPASTRA
ncbi:alpha/beta fold hydrolase [Nonomuraea sp. SYSU D8015]|uniref:alpha/beta fold hydrolase n=1 Tax=Nonomuraea sp. SYSU D8015 TaxID=2593644 RepID=UPI001CB73B83|nr:alpha/beta fold hydrolase [Nonomuraea sp. SYSU D8015]